MSKRRVVPNRCGDCRWWQKPYSNNTWAECECPVFPKWLSKRLEHDIYWHREHMHRANKEPCDLWQSRIVVGEPFVQEPKTVSKRKPRKVRDGKCKKN